MKITRRQLKRIISEELNRISEAVNDQRTPYYERFIDKLVENGMDADLAEKSSDLIWQHWAGYDIEKLDRVEANMNAMSDIVWGQMAAQGNQKGVEYIILKKIPDGRPDTWTK
jgi:hypothetical protein